MSFYDGTIKIDLTLAFPKCKDKHRELHKHLAKAQTPKRYTERSPAPMKPVNKEVQIAETKKSS